MGVRGHVTQRPSLAAELIDDRTSMGTTLKSVAPNMAEAMGHTPLDFLFIDRQHGSPVTDGIEHIIRAADLNALPVLVRVPTSDPSRITFLLDAGVTGIMLPQVEDPSFVAEANERIRYRDGRSIATTSRAAGFGGWDREAYVDHVNHDLALLPQIETRAGVEVVGEIARMEAVTSLAVGPGDLAKSLGVAPGSDDVLATIEEVFETAHANDCPVGIFVGDKKGIERYIDDATFLIYNSDVGLVTAHLNEVLSE